MAEVARQVAAGPPLGFEVRRVDLDRPWAWLYAGWCDMRAAPGIGLAYGAAFALGGFLITFGLWWAGLWYLVLPMTAGFLILGPLMAVGLYEASRRLGRGETPSLAQSLRAFSANGTQIAFMGLALLLFFMAWVRLAVLLFMLFFGLEPPSPERFMGEVFFSARHVGFVFTGFAVGAVLAGLAFAISVVSIPLLLDRPDSNVMAAIATSLRAVQRNPFTTLIWGALIVLFVGAGLATLYAGLVVTMPLIAYASWHAYRDLVGTTERG